MKFKQVTTVIYTQEVELTEEEAQDVIGVISVREEQLTQAWEDDVMNFIVHKLYEGQSLSVDTEITMEDR